MLDENLISKLMLDYSLWGVVLIELKNSKIFFSNNKANSLLSNSIESLKDRLITEFIPSEKEIMIHSDFYLLDGFYGEVYLRRENETLFPAQIYIKLIKHNEAEFSLVTFQDISSQKKMQRDLLAKHEGLKEVMKELVEKNDELQILNKAKSKFMSLVAHELRTPLTTIVATADVLYHKIYETEDEFSDLSKNLFQQSNQMLELVNDVLDLTKIHSGLTEFYIEQKDPSATIEKQISSFSEMAEKNNIQLTFNRPNFSNLCFFDSVRLDQIIGNLISNAIKFNRSEGQVTIEMQTKNDFVEISVADTGIGIDETQFSTIFNEFETIENIANHHKGTGLGLPIVRLLVEAQGGKVSLKSKLGVGTTFFVTLPSTKILASDQYRTRIEDIGFELFTND